MVRSTRGIGIAFTLAACASHSTSSGSGPLETADPACDPMALGLASAAPVEMYTPPTGCVAKTIAGGPIRSDAAFHDRFDCKDKSASAGVDFAKNDLMVSVRELSPAGAGG